MADRARQMYKNQGLTTEVLRRRREQGSLELRKQKRDEQIIKRRNVEAGGDRTDEKGDDIPHGVAEGEVKWLKVDDLLGADKELQLVTMQKFRKLLSRERNPPVDEIVAMGVVPIFVAFLQRDDCPLLQFEAAWALTNITSGTSVHTHMVVEAAAVPLFMRLLKSPNEELRDQVVWALGNIAGDTTDCRDYLVECNIIQFLNETLAMENKITTIRNIVWTMSNLCRGKNPPPDFAKISPLLPTLMRLLHTPDNEVLSDTCWAISYLTDGPNDRIQAVIDAGFSRRLVELLMHSDATVVSAALRAVGNIVTGDDKQTQVIINCSVLPCLAHLLNSPKESVRRETCWTVSNITAGTDEQLQAVIDSGIIPSLINALAKGEFRTRKEAGWAIVNALTGGSPDQVRYVVGHGAVPALCDLLNVAEARIVQLALDGLDHILRNGLVDVNSNDGTNVYATSIEECGGLDKIEALQQHENNEIYQKALGMISRYFSGEDVEDPNVDENVGQPQSFQLQPSADDIKGFQF